MKNAAARASRGPRQQIGRAAPGQKAAAAAAADAQRAAFGTLQQHDADQRRGDHQMQDEKRCRHGNLLQLRGCPSRVLAAFYTR